MLALKLRMPRWSNRSRLLKEILHIFEKINSLIFEKWIKKKCFVLLVTAFTFKCFMF